MRIYNLSFENAKEILKKLDEKFGLVYTRNKTAATGKTISAIIRKQDSKLYFADIHSNFLADKKASLGRMLCKLLPTCCR